MALTLISIIPDLRAGITHHWEGAYRSQEEGSRVRLSGLSPESTLISCVTLGPLLNLTVPLFPLLGTADSNSIC